MGRLIGRPTPPMAGRSAPSNHFSTRSYSATGLIARCQLTGFKQVLAWIVLVGQVVANHLAREIGNVRRHAPLGLFSTMLCKSETDRADKRVERFGFWTALNDTKSLVKMASFVPATVSNKLMTSALAQRVVVLRILGLRDADDVIDWPVQSKRRNLGNSLPSRRSRTKSAQASDLGSAA